MRINALDDDPVPLIEGAVGAALRKGVNVSYPHNVLMVWDDAGYCRAYSTHYNNLHWGVADFDGQATRFSRLVTLYCQ